MRNAIFLDLDGTLIYTKSGRKFPKDKDDWKLNEDILPHLRHFKKLGFMLIIVTNQGGIEKGFIRAEEFDQKITDVMNAVRKETGFKYKDNMDFFYSSSNSSEDFSRKPNPGMAYSAAVMYEIMLFQSVMVGDASGKPGQFSASDKIFAKRAGIRKYYDIKEFINDKNPWIWLGYREFNSDAERKELKEFLDDII